MIEAVVAVALGLLASNAAPEDLPARVRATADSTHAVLAEIGTSREGRPLQVLRFGIDPATAPTAKALLVVAGIDGRATFSVDAALALCEQIGAKAGDAFAHATLYVVPCLNPDARARILSSASGGVGGALTDFGGSQDAFDDDHDARVDEDGPRDVNGDGRISWMRVFDPPRGIERTHVPGKDDARTQHEADRTKGEVAQFAMMIEGSDGDGDGRFAEDGTDGVDFDQNFPHLWKEHVRTSGPYALSAPETNALVRWMLAHEEIACVFVFGTGDTLVNVPDAGKPDVTKESPLGIETDDKPWYDAIAEKFKELTRQKKAPKKDLPGSFVAWAYAQFGVPAFETPIFVLPKAETPEAPPGDGANDSKDSRDTKDTKDGHDAKDAKDAKDGGDAKPDAGAASEPASPPAPSPGGGRGGRRGGRGPGGAGAAADTAPKKPVESEADEARWIEFAAKQGTFTAWTAFTHPQLGRVEIGGIAPGARLVPPEAERAELIEPQVAFVADLLAKLPQPEVTPPRVERVDAAVWRVSAAVVNRGFLPTTSAIGLKLRRLLPVVFRLEVTDDALLSGNRVQRVETIAGSGGEARATWLVLGAEGSSVELTVRPLTQAAIKLSVRLAESAK